MTREEKNRLWFNSLLRISASEALKNEIDLLPSKEELDKKYILSDNLNKRINKIIIINRIKQKVRSFCKVSRKIALFIIILSVSSTITLLSVEATRNAIFNVFIEQYEKYTEIKFNKEVSEVKNNKLYMPNYLPQGFKETSTVTYGNSVMMIYTNDNGIDILFKQRPAETGTTLIDNENTKYKEIEINGNVAYLFEALTTEDYSVLLWQEDSVVFELESILSCDELIQVGSSFRK